MTGRSAGPWAPPRLRSRAGVILPVALLLLLGGTLMAAALLVTARSAVVLAGGDRALARALAVRSPFGSGPGTRDGTEELVFHPLREGFVLAEADAPDAGWSVWAVGWRVDPGRVAASLRATAETGGGIEGEGGEIVGAGGVGDDDCADAFPLAAHWLRGSPRAPRPEPELPAPPRLGPIGIERLAARADRALAPGEVLADVVGVVLVSEDGGPFEGRAAGLVVAPGTLRLAPGARIDGLVVASGDLVMDEGTVVHGAALVGGALRFEGGGTVIGCRDVVRKNLASLEALDEPFPLAGGHMIGRH